MRLTITVLLLAISLNSAAEVPRERFEKYVHDMFLALKNGNFDDVKKLSTAKSENYHKYIRDLLSKVKNRPYTVEIEKFSENDPFYQFVKKRSEGACDNLERPTHIIKVDWRYYEEKFTKGHQCYQYVSTGGTAMFHVKYDGKHIVEQACEFNPKNVEQLQSKRLRKRQDVTEEEYNSIKRWVSELDEFEISKIKTHITKKYKLGMSKRSEIIDKICHELWPVN